MELTKIVNYDVTISEEEIDTIEATQKILAGLVRKMQDAEANHLQDDDYHEISIKDISSLITMLEFIKSVDIVY